MGETMANVSLHVRNIIKVENIKNEKINEDNKSKNINEDNKSKNINEDNESKNNNDDVLLN